MYDKVKAVNKILEDQGAAAVQKFAKLKSTGRDIYGYQPQKVFDAMCEVFGPDSWFHEIISVDYTETQVVARVSVTLGERTSEQFGEHRIMKSDKGSACKSAVTDGIQKALSLFGIGTKAYRGELEAIFNSKVSQTIVDSDYISLKDEAEKLTDRKAGLKWWKDNLVNIKKISQENRDKLVLVLGKLK